MNDENAKLILNSFESHRSVTEQRGKTWRWAEGVILFPEALCPYCNGVMKSRWFWWVDDRSQRLIMAARFDERSNTQLVKVTSYVHPHVDGHAGGHVCCGSAKSASEALFLGLGLGSPYWHPDPDWYKRAFDHVCSGKAARRNSRDHLTASMALAEQSKPAPTAVVSQVAEQNAKAAVREAERAAATERIESLIASTVARRQQRREAEPPRRATAVQRQHGG